MSSEYQLRTSLKYLLAISVTFYSFYILKNIKMYPRIMFFRKMSYCRIHNRRIPIHVFVSVPDSPVGLL
jgi:hypothetical protein